MTQKLTPWSNSACMTYLVMGLIAAGMIAMSISEFTFGLFGIVPTIIGAAGLVFGWTNAPVFVLLSAAVALLIAQPTSSSSHLVELILAGSILTYVIAHYRLCSLTMAAFPLDTRKPLTARNQSPPPAIPAVVEFFMALAVVPYLLYLALRKPSGQRALPEPQRRTTTVVPGEEVVWALILVVCCSGVALAIWLSTEWRTAPLNTFPRQWQLGLILWIVVLPIIFFSAWTAYVRYRNFSTEEARLILADELWKETRREQRRLARWTNWARLRHEREEST